MKKVCVAVLFVFVNWHGQIVGKERVLAEASREGMQSASIEGPTVGYKTNQAEFDRENAKNSLGSTQGQSGPTVYQGNPKPTFIVDNSTTQVNRQSEESTNDVVKNDKVVENQLSQASIHQTPTITTTTAGNKLETYDDGSIIEYKKGNAVIQLPDGSKLEYVEQYGRTKIYFAKPGDMFPDIINESEIPDSFTQSSAMKSIVQEQASKQSAISLPAPVAGQVLAKNNSIQVPHKAEKPVTVAKRSRNNFTHARITDYSDNSRKTVSATGTTKIDFANGNSYEMSPEGDISIVYADKNVTIKTNAQNYQATARSLKSRAQIEALVKKIYADVDPSLKNATLTFDVVTKDAVNKALKTWNMTWEPINFNGWFNSLVKNIVTIVSKPSKSTASAVGTQAKVSRSRVVVNQEVLADSGVMPWHQNQ